MLNILFNDFLALSDGFSNEIMILFKYSYF